MKAKPISANESEAWHKLNRLLLSRRDFQQALSAATFLYEDMDEARTLPDWRRLRCYETNMVVAYARPFSQAHGPVKRLNLADLAVELSDDERALHARLIDDRNRLYAAFRLRVRADVSRCPQHGPRSRPPAIRVRDAKVRRRLQLHEHGGVYDPMPLPSASSCGDEGGAGRQSRIRASVQHDPHRPGHG